MGLGLGLGLRLLSQRHMVGGLDLTKAALTPLLENLAKLRRLRQHGHLTDAHCLAVLQVLNLLGLVSLATH